MYTSYRLVLTCWDYDCPIPFQTYIPGFFTSYAIANNEVVAMVNRELKHLNIRKKKAYFHHKKLNDDSILVYLDDDELYLPVTKYSIYKVESKISKLQKCTYYVYRSFSIQKDTSSKKYKVHRNHFDKFNCSSLDEALNCIDAYLLNDEYHTKKNLTYGLS